MYGLHMDKSHKQSEVEKKKTKLCITSEKCQSEKATYCMTPSIGHSGKGKTMETVECSVIAPRGVAGGGRDEQRGHRGFFGQ